LPGCCLCVTWVNYFLIAFFCFRGVVEPTTPDLYATKK
jgi:hypothetical protein